MGVFSRGRDDADPPPDERDMAFVLHERVGEAFGPIWRAQENRDAELMRPYVSEAYLERSQRQFDDLDAAAQIHAIEEDELRDVAVVRPEGQGQIETAEAYLLFFVRHSTVDLRTGEVIAGDAVARRAWTARWTFVFEPERGWVVDRLSAVWRAPNGRKPKSGKWPGLPPGWYSHRDEPGEWVYWDGSAWSAADQALVT
jgi:predicted lipid-binding transport protein (Tim44 family)